MTETVLHPAEVRERIDLLRCDREPMLQIGKELFGEPGSSFFPLDLLAYGALKRNLSTSAAIVLLVEAFNLQSARALLRIHIDTALRFAAAWFVEKPHDFAAAVHGGTRIDKMKDRDGKRLTDARLVELLSPDHPWLPAVYKNLSGYVHFSGSHVSGSIASFNEDTHEVSFHIGETDRHFPPFSWIEVIDCTRNATDILARYLHGYIRTKAMPPEELAARPE